MSVVSVVASLVSWCGLAGAWLLFAGAIYQAALELRAHEIARDRIQAIASKVPVPPRISPWWWLMPPVLFMLQKRRAEAYRRASLAALSYVDFAALLSLRDKGMGWLLVAVGGLLVAIQQTFQLATSHHWSTAVFAILALAPTFGSVLFTVLSAVHADHALKAKRAETGS